MGLADSQKLTPRALGFMLLLALQFGSQPLLTKKFIPVDMSPTAAVIACEVTKIVFSVVMLISEGDLGNVFRKWTLGRCLEVAAVPAMIYSMQNVCLQISYKLLAPVTMNVINQTKLGFTALAIYLMLGQPQSRMQMFALSLLGVAAFLLTLDSPVSESKRNISTQSQSYHWIRELHPLLYPITDTHVGLLCCFAASAMSGVASALAQKALQRDRRNSYLFTMELAFFTVVTLTFKTLLQSDSVAVSSQFPLKGWSLSALIPIAVNAGGGICVGQVTKLAGGVRKSFSIVLGIILTAVFDFLLLGIPFSVYVAIAVPVVGISLILHSQYPPVGTNNEGQDKKKI
eukprot:CFRG7211T1